MAALPPKGQRPRSSPPPSSKPSMACPPPSFEEKAKDLLFLSRPKGSRHEKHPPHHPRRISFGRRRLPRGGLPFAHAKGRTFEPHAHQRQPAHRRRFG